MDLNKYNVIRGSLIPHSVEKKIFEGEQKKRHAKFEFWLPLIITNLIAVIAIIVTILK